MCNSTQPSTSHQMNVLFHSVQEVDGRGYEVWTETNYLTMHFSEYLPVTDALSVFGNALPACVRPIRHIRALLLSTHSYIPTRCLDLNFCTLLKIFSTKNVKPLDCEQITLCCRFILEMFYSNQTG